MSDTLSSPVGYKSSKTDHTLSLSSQQLGYTALAEWQPLFEREKPIAQMFHVAYLVGTDEASSRPLTLSLMVAQELPLPIYTWGH
jgi:hypothetical protein